jgi:hypothetical protein
MRTAARKVSAEEAELLAVAALSFLAEEPERLGRFLAETGLEPASLRSAAATPGFLPAILDYLIGNEPLLLDFAGSQSIDPADIPAARAALPGARRID